MRGIIGAYHKEDDMSAAVQTARLYAMRKTQRESLESFDDVSDGKLNEQTLAAIAENEALLTSDDTKYYDSVSEMFDDILGTDWRK